MRTTATAISGATIGVDAMLVQVEVDLAAQLPSIATVGLAAAEVKEAKDRVRAAIRNAGLEFPQRKVTVNLAPADVPKVGTAFDLPIAAAVLAAAGTAKRERLRSWVMLGELALDGALRAVRGVLPVVIAARAAGCEGIVVPDGNGGEAGTVQGLDVRTARSLGEVVAFLGGELELPSAKVDVRQVLDAAGVGEAVDLTLVRGHSIARRALEIAAAGGHNLLLCGPPGTGKTLLARCLPSILPPMTPEEALEVTSIHSVAGLLGDGGLVTRRPFRAPHASGRPASLIGGGRPLRPGEISLAHHGVLFLDELPELDRDVLEALRSPLEDRVIHLSRAGRRVRFPCSFTLIAAMNPCPCGYGGTERCQCSEASIARYLGRISGPLLDRMDLFARFEPLRGAEFEGPPMESSAEVRSRVVEARSRARERLEAAGASEAGSNAETPRGLVEEVCQLTPGARRMIAQQVDRGLSGRSRDRALRIARTIADLEEEPRVRETHIGEAFAFRPAKETL